MPRENIVHTQKKNTELSYSDEKRAELAAWISVELSNAQSARFAWEKSIRDLLRMYEGIPAHEVRNVPIENAPNIEMTVGAIAVDSIYAQTVDLLWNTIKPLVTVQAVQDTEDATEDAKALQRFINWVAANESQARKASDHTNLDAVQIGTGIYYIPWVERSIKRKAFMSESRGPVIRSMPPEDVFVPGGAYQGIEELPWISLRFWYNKSELRDYARVNKFDMSIASPISAKDWIRQRRELLGQTVSNRRQIDLYETHEFYCYYDIDDDGYDEALLVTYDRASQNCLKVRYSPYDRRPIEDVIYQLRAHLFYGLGVLEMMRPFEQELTDLHNYGVLNAFLANARVWKSRVGSIDANLKVRPGMIMEINGETGDVVPEQMGEVYPSIWQAQAIVMQLAERRVGVNEMSMPRPSQVLGSRTPGITAMTLMQQVNRRFTPAYDAMRLGLVNALKQCLYRYQERLLSGAISIETQIIQLMGPVDGQRIIRVLKDENFDNSFAVELTASSVSVNREADRQNALILGNLLIGYYEKVLQLAAVSANPQTPPEVKEVAKMISKSASEVIERTIRTFDQVRDPLTFIVEISDAIDAVQMPPNVLQQLAGALGGMDGGAQSAPQMGTQPPLA